MNEQIDRRHGNVSHRCPIERESGRKIAGDADELAMNQYSARGGGGGDQLIIGTAAACAREVGSWHVRRSVTPPTAARV